MFNGGPNVLEGLYPRPLTTAVRWVSFPQDERHTAVWRSHEQKRASEISISRSITQQRIGTGSSVTYRVGNSPTRFGKVSALRTDRHNVHIAITINGDYIKTRNILWITKER